MKKEFTLLLFGSLLVACGQGEKSDNNSFLDAVMLGGDTTDLYASNSTHGFSTPAANLSEANLETHLRGDAVFEFVFVAAPNSQHPDKDGVGPAFNNTACDKCHQKDGRGTPPKPTEDWQPLSGNESLFLRISIEDDATEYCTDRSQLTESNNWCAPQAVPGFGTQLFHRGVSDLRPENPYSGQANVLYRYETRQVTYADGDSITLRKPVFKISSPYDAPQENSDSAEPNSALLQANVKFSPRIGPPVFAQGLLEAIKEEDILELADPDDSNNDGISGRPNYVYDPSKAFSGSPAPFSLGRMGWKANNPNTLVQSLGAFSHDMGITNYLFPDESTANSKLFNDYAIAAGLVNDTREVSDEDANAVAFYAQTLHVPARRNVNDAVVRQGGQLFENSGCSACHVPSFVTGEHEIAELSNQTIYPFTDMLLHDMGEGLADGRQDFLANGREWKTRPLWGIGLTKTVNPLAGFLHDGRALTLAEAILWHSGEAENAKENFRNMSKSERDALIAFLNSL